MREVEAPRRSVGTAASRRAPRRVQRTPPHGPGRSRRRGLLGGRGRLVLLGVLVTVLVLGGALAALGRPYGGLPDGTVVAGVDLSGRSEAQARSLLQERAKELMGRRLEVTAGNESLSLDLAAIGLTPRIDEAITAARDRTSPVGRIRQRLGLGEGHELPLTFAVDRKRLDKALRPLAKAVEEPIGRARVRVRANGSFTFVPGKGGIRMQRKVLVTALVNLPTTGASVELPVQRVQATQTTESARTAMTAAKTLLDTEHVIVLGGTRVPIPRRTLANAITFENQGSEVRLQLARPPLANFLHRVFGAAEKEPKNAQFAVAGDGSVNIVPEQDGRVADADAVGKALEEDPSRKEVPVQVVSRPATFTAADARRLGITDLVGQFTTPYIPGEPRVTNIQKAAETVDGTILQPGETFDLNQRLGERTIERGYVVAPMIDEGRLRDAVGGGVSQIATTVFNAAYLSGLEIVTHTPHEFWIPRYPQGQEATVSWGGPELIFRNDWDAALVMFAQAGADSVSVQIFSQKLERRVETGIDPPTDPLEAETRTVDNSELAVGEEETVQHGGQQGFTVNYWRKVWRGDTLVRDERYTHKYRPEDTIIEKGPDPEPDPGETDTDGTDSTGGSGPEASTGGDETPPPDTGEAPPATSQAPPETTETPADGGAPVSTGGG